MPTFLQILDELGVPYKLHGQSPQVTQGWAGIECPWCGKGTGKQGLGYNLERGFLTCWKCGPHGVVSAVMELTGLPFRQVKKLLGDLEYDRAKDVGPRGKLVLPKGVGPLLKCHKDYLRGRGFDWRELAATWGVQGIGLEAKLAWRLFIPIRYENEVVSWDTRSITDAHEGRYRAAGVLEEAVPRKSLLYGEDMAGNTVLVNEGYFDAWAIGPGAVATMGTGYSRAQVLRLSRFPVRVVVFDNEPEAQKRARRLCDELSVFPGETHNAVFETGKDASRADPAEVRELRRAFLD